MSAARTPSSSNAAADARPQVDWKWQIGKAILMYMGIQAVIGPNGLISQFNKGTTNNNPVLESSLADGTAVSTPNPTGQSAVAPRLSPDATSASLWSPGSPLDLYLYLSSSSPTTAAEIESQYSDLVPHGTGAAQALGKIDFDAFKSLLDPSLTNQVQHVGQDHVLAVGKWSNISLGDNSLAKDLDFTLRLDHLVRSGNGSIWADIILAKAGSDPDPSSLAYERTRVFHTRKLLTRLLPLKRKRVEKNLFKGNKDAEGAARVEEEGDGLTEEERKNPPLVAHWHKNLTLALVQDSNVTLPIGKLPPPMLQYVHVLKDERGEKVRVSPDKPQHFSHYPVVFPNDFWLLREHMYPINDTLSELPLHVNLYTLSWFKYQMLASMSDSFDKQATGAGGPTGGVAGSEIDMLKTMLLETNPWFLALTVIISILHSLFEFLAFSSDVKHWKNKDDLAGVSVGSILTNVVVQLIITLYLLDNNEQTSWMILAGQAVGVLIEVWKLTKAVTVGLVPTAPGSWLPYKLNVEDKHKLSEEEKRTQEYDRLAFKYVGVVVGPILVLYTIYSALYETHRGWWSFIISTATSFVYAFGFVSLVPQLIVNYKLKSTAGMNTKTFVYKILGTFVDDLFAFCIKMPTLHRLACFRDDIVFFIFLYQRWIYGVDDTRRNEFGQVEKKVDGKEDEEKDDKKGGVPELSGKGAVVAEGQATALEKKGGVRARGGSKKVYNEGK
ncbi:CLPTM1-domain-containing protein [Violaceomyces palustris]|uniref:CLPTM1-domain-containing protein n=1 Tax=Violaceomyces palustris TaxID=1673888 RepID=A0ACD0P8P1_9BASI|nr:CLPTM1-domain-containing protein [Violaceomyces palustris]